MYFQRFGLNPKDIVCVIDGYDVKMILIATSVTDSTEDMKYKLLLL